MTGIVRIQKHTDMFVVVDKGCLNATNLSWKAKGLWCYLLSLPDSWSVNITDLANRSKDGKASVQSAMHELMGHGYVSREMVRDRRGQMGGYNYTVYEVPPSEWATDDRFSVNGEPATSKEPEYKNNTEPHENKPTVGPLIQAMARIWKEIMHGAPNRGRIGVVAKILMLDLKYGMDDICDGWARYLKGTDPLYASPNAFASKAGMWIGRPQKPLGVVEDMDAMRDMDRILKARIRHPSALDANTTKE